MKRIFVIIAVLAFAATAFCQYTPESREALSGARVSKATAAVADLAIGTNSLTLDFSIPSGSIIWDGVIETTGAIQSTNASTTISLGTGQTLTDLLAATKLTNGFQAVGLDAIVPVGTAATAIQTTQAITSVSAVVSGNSPTNGAITVYLISID